VLLALPIGEVGGSGEAFQCQAELDVFDHPAAEALLHGDRQVAGQELRL
jgi:hypothetical protein